jgi:hypothetical protein
VRHLTVLMLITAAAACTAPDTPTQPSLADPTPPPAAVAAAANTWVAVAPPPYDQYIFGYDVATAPNAAGTSIVYTLGGTSADEGGTGRYTQTYNVATNTWQGAGPGSRVDVFNSNGVGRIGHQLYFSGGYTYGDGLSILNGLWAYDYAHDRMVRKADLPIFGADGVTGVIDNKLYVLPGTCSGERYPNPGYCAEEPTRRFYRYSPTTNSWVSRRPAPHFHRFGAAAVITGKLYVAGGLNGNTPLSRLDVYDPATNRWTTRASLPTGGPARGAALQGQFFVILNGSDGTIHAYAYNPATNSWRTRAAPASFGSVTKVTVNGAPRLFTATANQAWLYTP